MLLKDVHQAGILEHHRQMRRALILAVKALSRLLIPFMRYVRDLPSAERIGVDRPELFERLMMAVFPYRDITAMTPEGQTLYLRRFFLTPRRWRYRIFLHHICRSDSDRDPHSHPFDFHTTVLKAWYREFIDYRLIWGEYEPRNIRFAYEGDSFDNPAEHVHRLILDGPMWTFLVVSRARRTWGFLTKDGEVPWRTYLNLPNELESLEDV